MMEKRSLLFWRIMPAVLAMLQLTQLSADAQTTIRVPLNFPTIQQAINAAASGDTVLVSAGTYVENINFLGKAITVASEGGAGVTVIDGNQADSVAAFVSGETALSVLRGFTLRNGKAGLSGGGIRIENSSPIIQNNVIISNQACSGAGVAVSAGSPLIQRNTIAGNMQSGCGDGSGGGIDISGGGGVQILDNLIANNVMSNGDGGGISLFEPGTSTVRGNVIQGNIAAGLSPCAVGGGIAVVESFMSRTVIVQNLIVDNVAGCGGGVFMRASDGSGPLLVNNTVADNDSPQGSGVSVIGLDDQPKLLNNIIIAKMGQTAVFCAGLEVPQSSAFNSNDVLSVAGSSYGGMCTNQTGLNGNVSIDPLFVDPANGNYHLQQGSLVIDAGNNMVPELPATDVDGQARVLDGNRNGVAIVDMGIDEVLLPEGPDLTGSWNSVTHKCKGPAGGFVCKIKGKLFVHSQGTTQSTPARVRFYLSNDTVFDGADFFLKEADIGSLKVGRTKGKKLKVKVVTANNIAGQFLIAVIDADNAVAEINEVNNHILFGPLGQPIATFID